MVNRDISEDISESSSGLKAWWNRGSTQKAVGTFVDGFVGGLFCLAVAMAVLFVEGAAVFIWKIWPLL